MRFFTYVTVLSAGFAAAVPTTCEQNANSPLLAARSIGDVKNARDHPAVGAGSGHSHAKVKTHTQHVFFTPDF